MYSAKLVGNQMDTVFGLYLPEYEVPAPKVQTNYKEVPYRDGAIDKTAPDGVVTFEDREWSLSFQKTGEDVSAYDVPALSASLMNAIHGKSGEIIFDDDPNYKWVGRVFVENVQCENNGLIIANISLITQPYKYGIQDIVVTDTIETEEDEYQGSIVSFEYALGKELTKLLAHIEPIQSGSGDPSPSNIRPISGLTGLSVYVSPTQDPDDATVYNVDWSTKAGTVYHGTVDVVTGELMVTHGFITLVGGNEATYSNNGHTNNSTRCLVTISGKANGVDNMTSNQFAYHNTGDYIGIMLGRAASNKVEFYLPPSVSTNVADQKAWFSDNPTEVCYELATPPTYQLTPVQIAMLVGTNNVWSDAGDVDVTISTFDVVTLSNGRKPQSPKINVTSEGEVALMFFVKGTKHIVNLTAGEWSVPDLMLFEGDTDVYESGEGTVTYTYKEASL